MPIKDDKSKVIVSLLAGATAGIITGLLLAPETGEDTRKGLAEDADKLLKSPLIAKIKDSLARFSGMATEAAPAHPGQQQAEELLQRPSAAEPGDLATPPGAGDGHSIAGTGADQLDERHGL